MDNIEPQILDPLEGIDLDALQIFTLSVKENVATKYPERPLLNPKEVADVLWNKTDRSTVNGIRDRLVKGVLIPGLEKIEGRWLIPVEDLIGAFDGMVEDAKSARAAKNRITPSAGAPVGTANKRRWRAPIGHRPGIVSLIEQSANAWFEIFDEFDMLKALADRDELASYISDIPRPNSNRPRI